MLAGHLEMNGSVVVGAAAGLVAGAAGLALSQHGDNKIIASVQVLSKHLAACGVALESVETRLNAMERGGGGNNGGDASGLRNRVAGLEAEFQALQDRIEYLESQSFEERIAYLESVIEHLNSSNAPDLYEYPASSKPAKAAPIARRKTPHVAPAPKKSAAPRAAVPKAPLKRAPVKKPVPPPKDDDTDYDDDDAYLRDL